MRSNISFGFVTCFFFPLQYQIFLSCKVLYMSDLGQSVGVCSVELYLYSAFKSRKAGVKEKLRQTVKETASKGNRSLSVTQKSVIINHFPFNIVYYIVKNPELTSLMLNWIKYFPTEVMCSTDINYLKQTISPSYILLLPAANGLLVWLYVKHSHRPITPPLPIMHWLPLVSVVSFTMHSFTSLLARCAILL